MYKKNIMKKILFIIISYLTTLSLTFADWWILGDFKNDDTKTTNAIRSWNIHTDDIPKIIKWAIDFFMSLAWTIAVIFVIIWAYKILFGSLEQDKTKWKDTIFMALWGFALAALSWFIIKLIIDNLG